MTQEQVDGNGAASSGDRPEGSRQSGSGRTEGNGATRTFEAPHRLKKETFRTHLAGLTLLSFWRTSSWILGHLPAGPVYRVGGWFAVIGYAASPTRRRWLRANFGHVLGVSPDSREAGRMARAAYRNYARYIMELMRLPWFKQEQVDQLLEVRSLDRFVEINVVGDDSSYRELYELFERQRTSWGVKMISWRNLRGVYGALRRHEGLVLLVDWGYRADGIPVKMFGAWTTLPAGPALLAAKHGSAIVPFSINRQPDGTFRAASDEPIHVASNSPADLAIATQQIATALERHISPAPEQWYIFKPIWPESADEVAQLEARNRAAMANDAKGAAPNAASAGPTPTARATTRRLADAGAEGDPAQPVEP